MKREDLRDGMTVELSIGVVCRDIKYLPERGCYVGTLTSKLPGGKIINTRKATGDKFAFHAGDVTWAYLPAPVNQD